MCLSKTIPSSLTARSSFPSITKQVLRYVSDRTGIISFANFPLIWLFGMRNNVAIWITGWDFGTFNKFHRWVARIATVQAVIHSVGYTIILFRGRCRDIPRDAGTIPWLTDVYRGWMGLLYAMAGHVLLLGWRTGKIPPCLPRGDRR